MSKNKPGGFIPQDKKTALKQPPETVVKIKKDFEPYLNLKPLEANNDELIQKIEKAQEKINRFFYQKEKVIAQKLKSRLEYFGEPLELAKLSEIGLLKNVLNQETGEVTFYLGKIALLKVSQDKNKPGIEGLLFHYAPLEVENKLLNQLILSYNLDPTATAGATFGKNSLYGGSLKRLIERWGQFRLTTKITVKHSNGVAVTYFLNE